MSYAVARHNMVESQIRPNKVTDAALLAALDAVPRERFVPAPLRGVAYVDEDIPIGKGRFLIEPMVLARLLQLAAIAPTDAALDIGCGTGYAAAIMARLARRVVALEQDGALKSAAEQNLAALGIGNVTVVGGPLREGAASHGPFNVVLLEGSVESVPPLIADQLAEGGRLVGVIRRDGPGRAILMSRTAGVAASRVVFDAAVPALPGFSSGPGFVF